MAEPQPDWQQPTDRSTPQPPHPQFPPGVGYEWHPVVDDDQAVRLVTQPRRCRYVVGPGHRSCGGDALIEMRRGAASPARWWGYCLDDGHGYGRWLQNGQIMIWVQRRKASTS